MKWNKALPGIIIVLFLIVDFLAFHDIFEQHTIRDWLMLAGSIFIFVYIAKVSLKKAK